MSTTEINDAVKLNTASVYVPQIVDQSVIVLGKTFKFIPGITTQQVSDGYDLAIKSLQDAKATYLANPTESTVSTIEEIVEGALSITVLALDAEGKTTWAGYVQEAESLLSYFINHPGITKIVTTLGGLFKKKTVAATA